MKNYLPFIILCIVSCGFAEDSGFFANIGPRVVNVGSPGNPALAIVEPSWSEPTRASLSQIKMPDVCSEEDSVLWKLKRGALGKGPFNIGPRVVDVGSPRNPALAIVEPSWPEPTRASLSQIKMPDVCSEEDSILWKLIEAQLLEAGKVGNFVEKGKAGALGQKEYTIDEILLALISYGNLK